MSDARTASDAGVAVHPNIQRVTAHASAQGLPITVVRFAETTRTAEDAAAQIGCLVAAIVKSLVFLADDAPVVVLCSGADRIDLAKLRASTGATSVRRATADEAKAATGFPIGGVAPFGHQAACAVVADRKLLAHPEVWAAAGLPDAVFAVAPEALIRVSGARIADLAV